MSLPARPIRVLLAEDEDAVAALTQAVLAGEERIELVGRAREGHEAVALTEELSPDLVLMDIAMPELDGIGNRRRAGGGRRSGGIRRQGPDGARSPRRDPRAHPA